MVRDLRCSAIQVDEIWSYVGKKQARVNENDPPGTGEAYTFVALDVNSRLAISVYVGKRDEASTQAFIKDLRSRLVVMPAMTSDGFAPYVSAIGANFGASIDYAQCKKNYTQQGRRDDHRYEPPRDPFITKKVIYGAPDLEKASTSYVERQNLTMRHQIGRIRRLCLAFSKKIENHKAAVALAYCHYNFCHVVKTLRVTPAMQAGITDHIWSLDEFMEAILNEPEGGKPTPKPLAVRQPEGPARELPGGRGWLRLV
ncbi:transposase [Sorangium sp. So ce1153]